MVIASLLYPILTYERNAVLSNSRGNLYPPINCLIFNLFAFLTESLGERQLSLQFPKKLLTFKYINLRLYNAKLPQFFSFPL